MTTKNEKTYFEQRKEYVCIIKKILSKREIQVLKLISEGKSNSKIAKILGISQNTVKAHTIKIYEKLCVKDRVQAAVKAIQLEITE